MVFDIGDGLSGAEQIHGAGMAKAVGRVKIFKALFGQDHREVFPTEAVYSVPGQLFSTLIDEKAITIQRFGIGAVIGNIRVNNIRPYMAHEMGFYDVLSDSYRGPDPRSKRTEPIFPGLGAVGCNRVVLPRLRGGMTRLKEPAPVLANAQASTRRQAHRGSEANPVERQVIQLRFLP